MSVAKFKDATMAEMKRLLAKRGVSVLVRLVTRGPRTLTVDLRLADPDQYDKAVKIDRPLALAVGARNVMAYPHLGVVRYEIELPEALWRHYGMGELHTRMSIGVTSDRKEVGFSLGRPTSLVIGESGSGKSNLVYAMLTQAMRNYTSDQLRVGIVDPHGGFTHFSGKAHLAGPPAQDRSEIADVFNWFAGELAERKSMGEARVKSEGLPILWLVADECSSADVLGEGRAINESNMEVMRAVVKEGRKFSMRSLIITQKPTEADLPGILSISTNRYVGRVSKAVGTGLANADGAKPHLLTGKGDFLHVSPTETKRFQAVMVSEEDYIGLPAGIYPNWPVSSVLDDDLPEVAVGRPRHEIEPEILAAYMNNDGISRNMAREMFGFGQTIHMRYVEFSQRLKRAMNE